MNFIAKSAFTLVAASNGNPVTTTIVIVLFAILFNALEGVIETLIFGERFLHIIDPIFTALFIAYSAYAIWVCALFNSRKR